LKVLVLVSALAAVALSMFALGDVLGAFEAFTRSMGAAAPAVAALLYILATVFLMPGSAMTLTAAALFDFKTAFFVVFVGANLGSLCAFLMARTFLRKRIAEWAATKPQFRSVDQAIGRSAFTTVLLARLSPALPFNALNYFLGITSVGTRVYALATLIGILPGMIVYLYLGAAARDLLPGGAVSGNLYQQALKYVGLVATIILAIMITRRARKAFAQMERGNEPLASVPDDRA
jgi:uncharacterized membrane protein YdjX (TVP38/TMEM64 family)